MGRFVEHVRNYTSLELVADNGVHSSTAHFSLIRRSLPPFYVYISLILITLTISIGGGGKANLGLVCIILMP